MIFLLKILFSVIDNQNKKKIIFFIKKKLKSDPIVIIDVGAHEGETIQLFFKNFLIKKIISYEASKDNFEKLKNYLNKNHKLKDIVEINNIGIGKKSSTIKFNQMSESSSSTFCDINFESRYFKRKKKILDFFLKGDFINKSELISIRSLKNELEKYQLKKIDILKIDTEGFELNVLEGLGDKIKDVKLIYFEHHFDNMIMKNYTYTMIHSYLSKFNFTKVFKIKMPLRKTFEYIYQNKNFH